MHHYEKHFKGKTVLCNCDDPFESNFCKYFLLNFNYLGLKRLICTSYSGSPITGTNQQISLFDEDNKPVVNSHGYVLDVSSVPCNSRGGTTEEQVRELLGKKRGGVKKLKGNGSFDSPECIEYLKQADIVVGNPPFSLFRRYVTLLVEHDKKFLIIGNPNAVTYKEIFPLLKDNKMWLGYKSMGTDMYFNVPKEYEEVLKNTKKKVVHGRWLMVILKQEYLPSGLPT